MGLINCPYCGKEVSDRAKTCIHCGAPLKAQVQPVIVNTIPSRVQNNEGESFVNINIKYIINDVDLYESFVNEITYTKKDNAKSHVFNIKIENNFNSIVFVFEIPKNK